MAGPGADASAGGDGEYGYDADGFRRYLLGDRGPVEYQPPPEESTAAADWLRAALDAGFELTKEQVAVLEFERAGWRQAGAKEQAIRDQFGVPSTQYYLALNRLIDNPLAVAYDAVLVNRLRRLRDGRRLIRRRL